MQALVREQAEPELVQDPAEPALVQDSAEPEGFLGAAAGAGLAPV
ncbi:MAG: hypothetical protein WBL61_16260 [Bryobacteraceae bacterium]